MNRFALNLLILLFSLNLVGAQDNLKIMTFNIQGQRPGSNSQTRLYHIIQNLKELNPDIIGIQEINEDVNREGKDNGWTVPATDPEARIDFIFYKSTGGLQVDTSMVVMDKPFNGNDYSSSIS